MKVALSTPRLLLRELTGADFPVLCAILQDPAVMYAWEHAFSDAEVRDWIAKNRERYRRDGCGYWLALDRESGAAVGMLGVLYEEIGGERLPCLGWILARAYWGGGYAAEGGRACLGYAFDILGEPRVVADIRPENTASRRVALRLGMRETGMFVKAYRGKEMPHLIYEMKKEDRA